MADLGSLRSILRSSYLLDALLGINHMERSALRKEAKPLLAGKRQALMPSRWDTVVVGSSGAWDSWHRELLGSSFVAKSVDGFEMQKPKAVCLLVTSSDQVTPPS